MSAKESKTEKPTQKRLQDAKKKGDIARSQDFSASLSLGISLLFFVIALPSMGRRMILFWQKQLNTLSGTDFNVNFLTDTYSQGLSLFLITMMPLFLLLGAVAVFTNMIQGGGFIIRLENIRINFRKFNVMKGLKRIMMSVQALAELLKSIIKVIIIGLISYFIVKSELDNVVVLVREPLSVSLDMMGRLFVKLSFSIIIFLLILSIADYLFQKLQYMKKMKMTKQEIKDEYKQMEGDPKIKGKRRQIQYQRAMSRMMEKIPQADVVITNPTHYAVALQYEFKKMKSPMVIAKGKNLVALKIIERAKQHHIPVIENPPLARGLYASIELNQTIPEEFFKPVAEILAYIYKLKGRRVS